MNHSVDDPQNGPLSDKTHLLINQSSSPKVFQPIKAHNLSVESDAGRLFSSPSNQAQGNLNNSETWKEKNTVITSDEHQANVIAVQEIVHDIVDDAISQLPLSEHLESDSGVCNERATEDNSLSIEAEDFSECSEGLLTSTSKENLIIHPDLPLDVSTVLDPGYIESINDIAASLVAEITTAALSNDCKAQSVSEASGLDCDDPIIVDPSTTSTPHFELQISKGYPEILDAFTVVSEKLEPTVEKSIVTLTPESTTEVNIDPPCSPNLSPEPELTWLPIEAERELGLTKEQPFSQESPLLTSTLDLILLNQEVVSTTHVAEGLSTPQLTQFSTSAEVQPIAKDLHNIEKLLPAQSTAVEPKRLELAEELSAPQLIQPSVTSTSVVQLTEISEDLPKAEQFLPGSTTAEVPPKFTTIEVPPGSTTVEVPPGSSTEELSLLHFTQQSVTSTSFVQSTLITEDWQNIEDLLPGSTTIKPETQLGLIEDLSLPTKHQESPLTASFPQFNQEVLQLVPSAVPLPEHTLDLTQLELSASIVADFLPSTEFCEPVDSTPEAFPIQLLTESSSTKQFQLLETAIIPDIATTGIEKLPTDVCLSNYQSSAQLPIPDCSPNSNQPPISPLLDELTPTDELISDVSIETKASDESYSNLDSILQSENITSSISPTIRLPEQQSEVLPIPSSTELADFMLNISELASKKVNISEFAEVNLNTSELASDKSVNISELAANKNVNIPNVTDINVNISEVSHKKVNTLELANINVNTSETDLMPTQGLQNGDSANCNLSSQSSPKMDFDENVNPFQTKCKLSTKFNANHVMDSETISLESSPSVKRKLSPLPHEYANDFNVDLLADDCNTAESLDGDMCSEDNPDSGIGEPTDSNSNLDTPVGVAAVSRRSPKGSSPKVKEPTKDSVLLTPDSILPNQSEAGPEVAQYTEEEFRCAAEIFKDPSAFEFLQKAGNSKVFEESALSRLSLYVKFDPLIKESNPPVKKPRKSSTGSVKKPSCSVVLDTIDDCATIDPKDVQKEEVNEGARELNKSNFIDLNSPRNVDKVTSKMVPVDPLLRIGQEKEEKNEGPGGLTEADVKRALQYHELYYNQRLLGKDKEINDSKIEVQRLRKEIEAITQTLHITRQSYQEVVNMIRPWREKKQEEKREVFKERDQALEDLQNVESAFSDLHRRYEKSKSILEGYKQKEDELRQELVDCQEKVRNQEQMYEVLRSRTEEKLESANTEIEIARKTGNSESTVMKAQLMKADMKVSSLERTLEQKNQEFAQLSQIYDDLIARFESQRS